MLGVILKVGRWRLAAAVIREDNQEPQPTPRPARRIGDDRRRLPVGG